MKLVKQYRGEYKGQATIDGINIELRVTTIEDRGFSFTYYANGRMMYDDGWYGLRLKDIKSDIPNNIEMIIKEYKQEYK
jgi:hypothetical protein|tara:strand:- start:714 stop:950 length:237 start_codon:yes stop_codon:yes gene_type:complete